jgi:RimJ/RimL family protein N-acetyltransferase
VFVVTNVSRFEPYLSESLATPPPPLEMRKLGPNETDKVFLAPFWTGKGSPFPDATIPYLYARTKEDKLLRRLFPAEEEISLPRFIECLSRWPLVIGLDKATNDVMAYAFLSEYSGPKPWTKASIGFCFLKKYWGMPESRDVARLALDWFFNREGVAVLFGSVLWWNRMAISFSREFYFRELCTLPGFFYTDKGPENALLFCLQRDEFLNHFNSKFGGQ